MADDYIQKIWDYDVAAWSRWKVYYKEAKSESFKTFAMKKLKTLAEKWPKYLSLNELDNQ